MKNQEKAKIEADFINNLPEEERKDYVYVLVNSIPDHAPLLHKLSAGIEGKKRKEKERK